MSKDTFSVMFMWVTVHPPAPIFFGGMGDAAVDGGRSAARRLAASWRQASSMQWRAGCQASLTRWSSARRSSPSFRPTTRRARLNQLWCSPAAPLLPTVDWLNFRPEQWVPTAWNFVWDPLVQNSRLLYSIQVYSKAPLRWCLRYKNWIQLQHKIQTFSAVQPLIQYWRQQPLLVL